MWENYGEDAYVNAEMGREAVIGFQGENQPDWREQRCRLYEALYGLWCSFPVRTVRRLPSPSRICVRLISLLIWKW